LEYSNILEGSQKYYYKYANAGDFNLAKNWVMGGVKESGQEIVQVL